MPSHSLLSPDGVRLVGVPLAPSARLETLLEPPQGSCPRIRDMAVHEFGDPRVADAGYIGYQLPFASTRRERRPDSGFGGLCAHGTTIAKFCY